MIPQPPPPMSKPPRTYEMEVVNFNMPFLSMVGLIVKFWLAAILASSVFVVLGVLGLIALRVFFGFLGYV